MWRATRICPGGLGVLAMLVVIAVGGESDVGSAAVPIYHVRRATTPVRVDGVLDEFDWIVAERLRFVKFGHEPEDSQPLREQTEVAALWDDQNLYLAFIIRDREIWATIRERDARLFPEECVEFYLDPDGDGQRYIEAQINSLNNIRDLLVDGRVDKPTYPQYDAMAKWDFQHLQKEVRIYRDRAGRDLGWILELAIPWSELSFSRRAWPPSAGSELRINFYRYERSRIGRFPLELSGWSHVPDDFHDPPRFGRFIFSPPPSGSRE